MQSGSKKMAEPKEIQNSKCSSGVYSVNNVRRKRTGDMVETSHCKRLDWNKKFAIHQNLTIQSCRISFLSSKIIMLRWITCDDEDESLKLKLLPRQRLKLREK